jgi:hypothetical protein
VTTGAPLTFYVLVLLRDGTVIRYSTPLGVNATVVFCRDLHRWLLGSRPLGYRSVSGEDREITAADVSGIDLTMGSGSDRSPP